MLISKALKSETKQVQPFSKKPGAFKVIDSGQGEDSFHGIVLIVNKNACEIQESFDFTNLKGMTILGKNAGKKKFAVNTDQNTWNVILLKRVQEQAASFRYGAGAKFGPARAGNKLPAWGTPLNLDFGAKWSTPVA